jgi:hypothetical protein
MLHRGGGVGRLAGRRLGDEDSMVQMVLPIYIYIYISLHTGAPRIECVFSIQNVISTLGRGGDLVRFELHQILSEEHHGAHLQIKKKVQILKGKRPGVFLYKDIIY